MNRLQKKCFIASAGFHLSLLLILFVGPAFFNGNKQRETQVLTFFDLSKITDGPTTGTGNPNPTPPAPQPQIREIVQPAVPQPQTPTPIIKPREPAPEPEPEKEIKINEKNPFAEKPPKKKIEVSSTVVKRNTVKPAKSPAKDDSEAKAHEQAAKIATQIRNSVSGLKTGLSKSTVVDFPTGSGGDSGSVNWAQAVVSIYYDAWVPPDELAASDNISTKVSITISANGEVVSTRVTKPSGISAADDSVRRALNRVSRTVPFPAGSKDKDRTISIIFNPIVKKQAG